MSGLEAVFLGGFGTFEHQDPERSPGHYGYVLEKDAGTPTPLFPVFEPSGKELCSATWPYQNVFIALNKCKRANQS